MDSTELLQRIKGAFWEHLREHGSRPYDLSVPKYRTGEPRVPIPQVAIVVDCKPDANQALKEALRDETALDQLKHRLKFHLSPASQDRYELTISMCEPKTPQA